MTRSYDRPDTRPTSATETAVVVLILLAVVVALTFGLFHATDPCSPTTTSPVAACDATSHDRTDSR